MGLKNSYRKACFLLFVSAFSFFGCTASYTKQIVGAEKMFVSGNFLEAARTLLPYVNKENEDQLLFMMEAGLMLHTGSEFEKSNSVLLPAGKIADNIATSVSQEAGALFLNDTVTNYKGEDHEVVLLHYYLGLNFLMLNKPEEARVEFNKIDTILRSIKQSGGSQFKQNLMAKYLYAVAYEISADVMKDANDYNDAYIEYKQIYERMPLFDDVKLDLLRMSKKIGDTEDYNKWKAKFGPLDSKIPADAGELVLLYQSGLGAVKASRGKLIGNGSEPRMSGAITSSAHSLTLAQGVTVAAVLASLALAENPIPKFDKRSNKVNRLEISAEGILPLQTIMLEDIENTAVKNLEEKYGTMFAKAAAGIVVKVAASVTAGILAKKAAEQIGGNVGKFSGLIGAATGAVTGAGLAANIKPDLRCWHTLPANLQVRKLFLKPGEYDMKVDLVSANGAVMESRTQKIIIAAGKKTLLNYRTLY